MESKPIFISLSSEVLELLADNQVDLVDELQKEMPDIQKASIPDPSTTDDNRTRSVVLVILASSAAFYAVTMGIERIINAISNKPTIVNERELVPILDTNGNPLHDNNGQILLQWVNKTKIVESIRTVQEKNIVKGSFLGLSVELTNAREQG